jgi:hypothetical protein
VLGALLTAQMVLSDHLIRVLFGFKKMAESDWRAQIERVRQNDPTLTRLE